jgi:hypothetical protein
VGREYDAEIEEVVESFTKTELAVYAMTRGRVVVFS